MNLPQGRLVRSRVVSDPATAIAAALDRRLTGYAVFEPQDALLLESEAKGVLTFESGVPVLAYHTRTDRGGPSALADLAVPGPYSVELYELDASALAEIHDTPELRVPPGMPAERLGGNPDLAERTRESAPASRFGDQSAMNDQQKDEPGALESFLDDAEKIEAIREQAREEAASRAEEWGLTDALE